MLLSSASTATRSRAQELLEGFGVLCYERTSEVQGVDEARKVLFAKGRQIDRIPPTSDALLQHTRRAHFQAGRIWGRAADPIQNPPSPSEFGWKLVNDEWHPVWTTLPEASKACKELVKCGCKKACKPPCKCMKASLPCIDLCARNAACYRSDASNE